MGASCCAQKENKKLEFEDKSLAKTPSAPLKSSFEGIPKEDKTHDHRVSGFGTQKTQEFEILEELDLKTAQMQEKKILFIADSTS